MKHSKQNQLTRANSRQAIKDLLKRQLQKICRNNDDIQMLKDNLCLGREHKFKSISTSSYPQEEKDLRMRIEVEYTRRLMSQTAHHIMDLYWEVEKQLEGMEKEACKGVQSTLESYSEQVLNTAEMIIFKEIEGMKVKDLEGAMNIYAELMEAELMDVELVPQPETESELLKLIVEYRHMLKTIFGEAINIKYIELIKVDLQTKILSNTKTTEIWRRTQ